MGKARRRRRREDVTERKAAVAWARALENDAVREDVKAVMTRFGLGSRDVRLQTGVGCGSLAQFTDEGVQLPEEELRTVATWVARVRTRVDQVSRELALELVPDEAAELIMSRLRQHRKLRRRALTLEQWAYLRKAAYAVCIAMEESMRYELQMKGSKAIADGPTCCTLGCSKLATRTMPRSDLFRRHKLCDEHAAGPPLPLTDVDDARVGVGVGVGSPAAPATDEPCLPVGDSAHLEPVRLPWGGQPKRRWICPRARYCADTDAWFCEVRSPGSDHTVRRRTVGGRTMVVRHLLRDQHDAPRAGLGSNGAATQPGEAPELAAQLEAACRNRPAAPTPAAAPLHMGSLVRVLSTGQTGRIVGGRLGHWHVQLSPACGGRVEMHTHRHLLPAEEALDDGSPRAAAPAMALADMAGSGQVVCTSRRPGAAPRRTPACGVCEGCKRPPCGSCGPCRLSRGTCTGRPCLRKAPRSRAGCKVSECVSPGCGKAPSYGIPGTATRRWCAQHAPASAINLKHPRCEAEGCHEQASVCAPDSSKRRWCAQHAPEGSVYAKARKRRTEESLAGVGRQDRTMAALVHTPPDAALAGLHAVSHLPEEVLVAAV